MPQITVNEIDQSVVTRVVQDDRVKILVPVISSFGPTIDGTNVPVNTFTDVTDYDRMYGYTPAQFNPIEYDQSRTYARELIKKGAAVSVVRINGGAVAEFDIGPTTRTTPSVTTMCPAAMHTDEFMNDCHDPSENGQGVAQGTAVTFTADADTSLTSAQVTAIQNMVPGTFTLKVTIGTVACEFIDNGSGKLVQTKGPDTPFTGSINYATSVIVINGSVGSTAPTDGKVYVQVPKATTNFTKYTFCPQIKSIKAKYSGSFGNNLMMTISAVNTSRLSESFQYANISVYYLDRTVVYDEFGDIDYNRSIVKSTTLLETKMVTTNPNDPRYFEDVEFDFIKIEPAPGAREDLSIVWSNINADPVSTTLYPGFPVIPFKVSNLKHNIVSVYNYDAFATKEFGTDFLYVNSESSGAPQLLDELKKGFKGYTDANSVAVYNEYIKQVYGTASSDEGIFKSLMSTLCSLYANFTDPYIYDFDFVTSGGFVYMEYTVDEDDEIHYATPSVPIANGDGSAVYTTVTPLHERMKELVLERKDCMILIDVPDNYDPNQITEYSRLINTSYATMHFPWCEVASPYIAGARIWMAPSYIFLYTFMQNLENNVDSQKWFPPAGVKRARARVIKKPKFEIGSVYLNEWQNLTTARVNPFMKLKDYGYVIYGQYTCLEAIDMYTHSALESINVRLVANTVKKKIFEVCLNLAFDPNTEELWNRFFDQMDQFLRYMKFNGGVYDYRIVMDKSTVTTDDINHLRCPGKVFIAPTRTAEFFDIDFIITDAGAVFAD